MHDVKSGRDAVAELKGGRENLENYCFSERQDPILSYVSRHYIEQAMVELSESIHDRALVLAKEDLKESINQAEAELKGILTEIGGLECNT